MYKVNLNLDKSEIETLSEVMGKTPVYVVTNISEKYELENNVEIIPYIPHDKIFAEQVSSQVLLLLINNSPSVKGLMTGKIFEYMASGRPTFAIGPVDGDIARVLNETNLGVIVDFEDKEGMKKVIIDMFNKYKNNQLVTNKNENIEKYSRRYLSKEYVKNNEKILKKYQC